MNPQDGIVSLGMGKSTTLMDDHQPGKKKFFF